MKDTHNLRLGAVRHIQNTQNTHAHTKKKKVPWEKSNEMKQAEKGDLRVYHTVHMKFSECLRQNPMCPRAEISVV